MKLSRARQFPELYTSYWNSPLLESVDAVKVSTSRGEPKRRLPFRYRKLWSLCPSRETFQTENAENFEESYLNDLEASSLERIMDDLERISTKHGGRPLILLCHEKNPAECHRSRLAAWLEEQAGLEVPELKHGMLPEREDATTPKLF